MWIPTSKLVPSGLKVQSPGPRDPQEAPWPRTYSLGGLPGREQWVEGAPEHGAGLARAGHSCLGLV